AATKSDRPVRHDSIFGDIPGKCQNSGCPAQPTLPVRPDAGRRVDGRRRLRRFRRQRRDGLPLENVRKNTAEHGPDKRRRRRQDESGRPVGWISEPHEALDSCSNPEDRCGDDYPAGHASHVDHGNADHHDSKHSTKPEWAQPVSFVTSSLLTAVLELIVQALLGSLDPLVLSLYALLGSPDPLVLFFGLAG